MENYADTIIKNYKKKLNCVQYNMNTTGIFPDRNEPLKSLDFGQETVLKTIFQFKIGFLEELSVLFAYCYSKQKFESLIADLEAQGYITSQVSKDYGKYFVLTPKALYYIYTDRTTPFAECNISEDKLPKEQKLIYYKCQLGYFSNQIFEKLTEKHWNSYQREEKDFRRDYSKKQFIKQYIYSQTNKNAYSKTEAETFATKFIPTLDSDEELTQRYKRFIQHLKEHSTEPMLRFHFLKDYYNSHNRCREQAIGETINELKLIFNNVYRDRYFTYRTELYKLSGNSPGVKSEFDLFTANELLRVMAITRRSLLNSQKAEKTESKLQEILQQIEDLDRKMEQLTNVKENLLPNFETMIFDKYSSNETPTFIENTITLESLKNMNVYITGCHKAESGKYSLEFSIIQPTVEDLCFNYLFKRIESIFKFYRSHLLMFDYKIKVITFTPKQKELLETKLTSVKSEFELFPEYAMLLLAFDDGIEVVATKQHLKERYEVFRDILKHL